MCLGVWSEKVLHEKICAVRNAHHFKRLESFRGKLRDEFNVNIRGSVEIGTETPASSVLERPRPDAGHRSSRNLANPYSVAVNELAKIPWTDEQTRAKQHPLPLVLTGPPGSGKSVVLATRALLFLLDKQLFEKGGVQRSLHLTRAW